MQKMLKTASIVALGLFLLAGAAMAQDQQPFRPGLADGASTASRKKIVFISGRPSHGYAQHEHFAGCMLLARLLNENVPQVEAVVYKWAWPTDPHAFDNAAEVVIYCDGGGGHIALQDDHLKQISALMDKGVGFGCIHYAVEVPADKGGPEFLKWIGGYFESNWSINPEWNANFTKLPDHPVASGVRPFMTHDEWYYHMRFRNDMKDVTPLLSAIPPATVRGSDAAHNGTPELHAERGVSQHVMWLATRENDGRGFGLCGGHFHFNWAHDDFRKITLNTIIWAAHVDVPKEGVNSKTPTVDELLANLDAGGGKRVPGNFDKAAQQKKIEEMNAPPKAATN